MMMNEISSHYASIVTVQSTEKYEIDMKCEDPRKIWEVHEGHDFEASSQFQAAEREQTEPTKPHRFAEPVFYHLCSARETTTIKFQQIIPI